MNGLIIATFVLVVIMALLGFAFFVYWVGYAGTITEYITRIGSRVLYRYISGYSWEDVADAMGYEQRRVFALHGLALEKVQIPERCHKNAVKCSANM